MIVPLKWTAKVAVSRNALPRSSNCCRAHLHQRLARHGRARRCIVPPCPPAITRRSRGARVAPSLALASNPGKFLSTVQIGITLVGVLSGAISGATLGLRLGELLASSLGLPPVIAETIGVGLVVALITYVSLIIGELVPKQIALRNPERVALKVAPAMTVLARLSSPLVSLLDVSGRLVLRALGHHAQPMQRARIEEIRTLIAEAETAGVIEPGERAMIAGVMRLGDRPVRAVMTPRREVDGGPAVPCSTPRAGISHSCGLRAGPNRLSAGSRRAFRRAGLAFWNSRSRRSPHRQGSRHPYSLTPVGG